MPTQAQINANRLKAQKSTGPTSPEGKARSSLNPLKSGIDAWSHIIPGEDSAEVEALTAQFLLHFHPSDPNQLAFGRHPHLRRVDPAPTPPHRSPALELPSRMPRQKSLPRRFPRRPRSLFPHSAPYRCYEPHVPPY